MGQSFPTGHSSESGLADHVRYGEPERAAFCRCLPAPLVSDPDESCLRCGKYTRATVSRTWHRRAQQIAARNRARRDQRQAKRPA